MTYYERYFGSAGRAATLESLAFLESLLSCADCDDRLLMQHKPCDDECQQHRVEYLNSEVKEDGQDSGWYDNQ